MLLQGIHLAIVSAVLECCEWTDTYRKRRYPESVGKICSHQDWIDKGHPNPSGSIPKSEYAKVNPWHIFRMLQEFFQHPNIKERINKVLEVPVGRTSCIMAGCNGNCGEEVGMVGGLMSGYIDEPGQDNVSPQFMYSWYDFCDETPPGHEESQLHDYYLRKHASGHYVYKHSYGVGITDDSHMPYRQETNMYNWSNSDSTRPHDFSLYQFQMSDDPDYKEEWYDRETGNTIKSYSAYEKQKYITIFMKHLCENYKGEQGNIAIDRASWYEVSLFIDFYCDTWAKMNSDGDSVGWCDHESYPDIIHTTTSPGKDNYYSLPGMWDPEDDGNIYDNFKTFMSLGVDNWLNSIWNLKFTIHCINLYHQGIFNYRISHQIVEEPEVSDEQETDAKTKMIKIMSYLYDKKEDMKENVYLDLSNMMMELNKVIN